MAGIGFVMLLYALDLTVTKATISGIILYADVISINDSAFLVNINVSTSLKLFLSFINLNIGIETCFYNVMSTDMVTVVLILFLYSLPFSLY